jgi:hypothetical protein
MSEVADRNSGGLRDDRWLGRNRDAA